MPITKSAKKALRQAKSKQVFNIRREKKVDDVSRKIKKLVGEKKIEEAKKLLPLAYKALDKAAKGGTIKSGNAARNKSRLAAFIKKADLASAK